MGYSKTILCLANSIKYGGRCVAGREVGPHGYGAWVRAVSHRPTHELLYQERQYEDGTAARVMEIFTIPFDAPAPATYQSENHVIARRKWKRVCGATWGHLQNALDPPPTELWANGESSLSGRNDRISEATAHTLGRSLFLIQPSALRLLCNMEAHKRDAFHRSVRAEFEYGGCYYKLKVTDPIIEETFGAKQGAHELRDVILCLSLSEIYQGHAYKLVATIFRKDAAGANA